MRILVTIAHVFNPDNKSRHASQRQNAQPRIQALTQSLAALHQLFSPSQDIINIAQRKAIPANQPHADKLDIIICTTQTKHLLNHLPLPEHFYKHHPWFFVKLNWFTQQAGNLSVLQPNRYEVSTHTLTTKAYIDGDLAPKVTAPFQTVQEKPNINGKVMGMPITFHRALNPHSGCYFLNANQMEYWVNQPHFLDRDTRFISPLESAATLGIMKTFRIYKPSPNQANFLEIQHFGSAFVRLIGERVSLAVS